MLKPTKWKILSVFIFSLALVILIFFVPYFGFRDVILNLSSQMRIASIVLSLIFGMIVYYPLICGVAFLSAKPKKKAKEKFRKRKGEIALAILLIVIFNPIVISSIYSGLAYLNTASSEPCGMQIQGFAEPSPAKDAGMKISEIVIKVDESDITDSDSFLNALAMKKPGEDISITTNASSYNIRLAANPQKPESAFLGIKVKEKFCAG